jgi:two-component system, sensor histidine kinase
MSSGAASDITLELDEAALVIADRRGRIVYWSAGASALFGYSAEAMVGKGASVLVPPAYRRRHTAGFRQAWAGT